MGRQRVLHDPDKPLPKGLQKHGAQFRARLSPEYPWTYFGRDWLKAIEGFKAWQSTGRRDDVAWLLNYFTAVVCSGKVRAKRLAQRTGDDYQRDAEVLKAGLGTILIAQLQPVHVVAFRDARAEKAPSHVRNEMACLSAALSWAVESGRLAANPCLQVQRPSRRRRERLVSHDEYLAVHAIAIRSVKIAMAIAVRTLALPGDLLAMGPRNLIRKPDGVRVLRYRRGKTSVPIEVEVTGELEQLVDAHLAAGVVHSTFVHREDGARYTVEGIGGMFRRYCVGTKERRRAYPIADFGLRDLRAKGATDMFRAGVPIRQIQILLGHKSVRTTEIYLKDLIPETVRPNETTIVASIK